MGEGEIGHASLVSGASGAAPMVAGIRCSFTSGVSGATARQIRNAIIQSANPNFVNNADVLDQGHGYANAAAAATG